MKIYSNSKIYENVQIQSRAFNRCYCFLKKAQHKIELHSIIQIGHPHPDVEVEFSSAFTLSQLIKIMSRVPDGHVMYQTIQLIENYTGERTCAGYQIILNKLKSKSS